MPNFDVPTLPDSALSDIGEQACHLYGWAYTPATQQLDRLYCQALYAGRILPSGRIVFDRSNHRQEFIPAYTY